MDKVFQKDIKKKLEVEKKKLTNDLKSFAKKDPNIQGNWLTRFPFFGTNRSHKDERAEVIEEYEKLLPVEHTLELRLQDIEKALVKLKKGGYGHCETCDKKIRTERLKVVPEASLCLKCGRKEDFK